MKTKRSKRMLALFLVSILVMSSVPFISVQQVWAVDQNLAAGKHVVAISQYNSSVPPENAVDGSVSTKWTSASGSGPHWLRVDLGQVCDINRWVVKHAQAGGESANYNTMDFKLQVSDNGYTFKDVDIVMGNTASVTDRNITAKGRFVKLYITQATQPGAGGIARIYEFEVWGSAATQPAMSDARPSGDLLMYTVANNAQVGHHYYYNKFSNISHPFQSGDYIEYDVIINSSINGIGGIDIGCGDGTYIRNATGWLDQNGISGHPGADLTGRALNKWYHRKLAVPGSIVGKTSNVWDVAADNYADDVTFSARYDNICITDGNGTIKKLIFKNDTDVVLNTVDISLNASSTQLVPEISFAYDRNTPDCYDFGNYIPGDLLLFYVRNTSSGTHYFYNNFSTLAYTFQSGNYIEYDVFAPAPGTGGIDIRTTDNLNFRDQTGWQDQNSLPGHPTADLTSQYLIPSNSTSKWYHRKLAVPASMVGKTSALWKVAGTYTGDNAFYCAYYANIAVTNGSGAILKSIYQNAGDETVNTPASEVSNASAWMLTYRRSNPNPVASALPNPSIKSTTFASEDKVIAEYSITDSPYNADGTGVNDATGAIRNALNDCFITGGGTVFVPSGKYKITEPIIIPPGITLRGDWRDPDQEGNSYGSVILAYVKSGGEFDQGLFRLKTSACINGLTIYYPNQSASNPISYPYTFELMTHFGGPDASFGQAIMNCTLLNSYYGIRSENTQSEYWDAWGRTYNVSACIMVRNVKGTVLSKALSFANHADVSRIEKCKFGNAYWANAGSEYNAPSESTIDSWTRANGTGIKIGDCEWIDFADITLSDYNTGILITIGDRMEPCGTMFGATVTECNKALDISNLDHRVGFEFSNCTFQASVGTSPVAVDISNNYVHPAYINDSPGTTMFNTCTIGGGADTAVKLTGNTMATFSNCTFDSWSGTYALDASNGTLAVEGCSFTPALTSSKKGIRLQSGTVSAAILGNTYSGTSTYLLDNNSTGDVKRQDSGYSFDTHGVSSYQWKSSLPAPASNNFYNVKAAPYNAKGDSITDDTNAIQSALNAASTNGGTVYAPAGMYKISTHLTVPANVELRGSFGSQHGYSSKGTTLLAYEGKDCSNPDTSTAFITLSGTNAGVRGLNIAYPEQEWNNIHPYPWTIRGNGSGIYVMDISLINSYCGVDAYISTCNNHFIRSVNGTGLSRFIRVGSSTEGWVEDCHNNATFWAYTDLPYSLGPQKLTEGPFVYMRPNLIAYIAAGSSNEHLLNNFTIGTKNGFYFDLSTTATLINCTVDNSREPFLVLNTSTTGVTAINSMACVNYKYGDNTVTDNDAIDVHAGVVKFFNFALMVGLDKGLRVRGGTCVVQGASFDTKMAYIAGGTARLNAVVFKTSGTHVTVDAGATNCDFSGNAGKGGFTYVNNAGANAVFSNNITRGS